MKYDILEYDNQVLFKVYNPEVVWYNRADIIDGELSFDFNTGGVKNLGQEWTNDAFKTFGKKVTSVKAKWTVDPAYPKGSSLGYKEYFNALSKTNDKELAVQATTFYKTMEKRGFKTIDFIREKQDEITIILK